MKYTINQGDHRSTYKFGFTFQDVLHFKATFGFDCLYDEKELEYDAGDINKLYGFSDGFDHMKHSARFGWNSCNGIIQLFAYAHVDGMIVSKLMAGVNPGVETDFKIYIMDDIYMFDIGTKSCQIARAQKGEKNFRYFLYPYFGGQQTAPRRMTFNIKKQNLYI